MFEMQDMFKEISTFNIDSFNDIIKKYYLNLTEGDNEILENIGRFFMLIFTFFNSKRL